MEWIPILLVVSISFVQAQVFDPCLPGNHQLIIEPHRSTLFVPESTDRLLCDRNLRPGWYVFDGKAEIPTKCVAPYHCGTHAPIWINGANPSVADGAVNREACINYGIPSTPACCNYKLHIQVKNCGNFFVYYLGRTPGCPAAYCAGNQRVCDIGAAKNGGPTCKDLYPKMTQFPTLGKPEVTQNNQVRFPCTVHYQTGEPDVAFEVTWTVDGHELLDPVTHKPIITTLTGDSRVTYLDANKLQGNLDKNLRCNVTSYHPSDPGLRSDSISSNPYWVGIKVSTDRIIVDEKGGEKEITIESTIPIPCNALNQNDCKFPLEIHQNKDPTDISWQYCAFDLMKDPITGTYKTTIKVKATRDFINDHDKVHEIAFEPVFNFNYPLWNGYNVSSIHVKTLDQETADCASSGDPHMRGFDHKKNYNIYKEGDFLLYGAVHQSRPFEVQARNWGCGSYHPCTCAIVAREGNDVIMVDMCEKRMNEIAAPVVKKLSSGPLDGTTVTRDKSGKNFYINFPSGARVTVAAHVGSPHGKHEKDGFLTVHVQAPSDDLGKTEGLCGDWNGKNEPDHDLEGKDGVDYDKTQSNNFAETWRISRSSSLFEQVPKHEAHLSMGHEYCNCKAKQIDCSKGKGSNNPNKNICAGGPCLKPKFDTNTAIIRRNIEEDSIDITRKKKHVRRDATFPTPSGITKARATQMCTAALQKSTLYHLCQHMPVMNMDSFIDGCIEDVKYADGDLFTISHMNAYDMVCQNEVMKDVTRYHYSSDGEPIPPVEITSGICPDQCSLQGRCVHGQCHCNAGYTSIDCSVKINSPPDIHRIIGYGACDSRTQDCTTVSVIAENIMDSTTLSCKFQTVGTAGSAGSTITVKGQFVNFLQIDCPVPTGTGEPLRGFKLSITNDGHLYSVVKELKIYDSNCYQCADSGQCTQKADSCLIDGQCHKKGEQNDDHQICDPTTSTTQWTTITDEVINEIDHFTSSPTGCQCSFNTTRYDCACCKNNGCPCGRAQINQCVACNKMTDCGKKPDLLLPQKK